jgi:hypothetical protein
MKTSNKFSILFILFALVGCSQNNALVENSNVTPEVTNSPSANNGSSVMPLPAVNVGVEDFASAAISSQDIKEFNGDSVKHDERTFKHLLNKNNNGSEAIDLSRWGLVKKITPSECEFVNLLSGTTQKFIKSSSVLGKVYSYDTIGFTNSNYKKAKIATIAQGIFVFSDSNSSKKVFDAFKISLFTCAGKSYTQVLSDDTFEDVGGAKFDYYRNESGNLILGVREQKGVKQLSLNILHGVTYTQVLLLSGYNISKSDGFGFADQLIQKMVDSISKVQNIDTFEVDLTKLGSFSPSQESFEYPLLDGGNSI